MDSKMNQDDQINTSPKLSDDKKCPGQICLNCNQDLKEHYYISKGIHYKLNEMNRWKNVYTYGKNNKKYCYHFSYSTKVGLNGPKLKISETEEIKCSNNVNNDNNYDPEFLCIFNCEKCKQEKEKEKEIKIIKKEDDCCCNIY